MRERIFISSVQKELSAERRALRDFVRGDPLLGQYFEEFLFEDLPASDGAPDQTYLAEVDRSTIYLGLIGNEYGWEDEEGVSPTERATSVFPLSTTKVLCVRTFRSLSASRCVSKSTLKMASSLYSGRATRCETIGFCTRQVPHHGAVT